VCDCAEMHEGVVRSSCNSQHEDRATNEKQ
jgi:hypothetical protein